MKRFWLVLRTGPWALRPKHTLGLQPTTTAIQAIRSSGAKYRCGTQPKRVTECYTILAEHEATIFEYHPTHNHWHTGQVALFQIRQGSPTGPVAGGQQFKTGFCLIDHVNPDGNARAPRRSSGTARPRSRASRPAGSTSTTRRRTASSSRSRPCPTGTRTTS